jgi:hypothetical protein
LGGWGGLLVMQISIELLIYMVLGLEPDWKF